MSFVIIDAVIRRIFQGIVERQGIAGEFVPEDLPAESVVGGVRKKRGRRMIKKNREKTGKKQQESK